MTIHATLVPHPDFPSSADGIAFEMSGVGPRTVELRYVVHGPVQAIEIPVATPSPARRDELWKATCFELFLRVEGEPDYFEFNFSPSGDWAAYRFSGYRDGMAALEMDPPRIDWGRGTPPWAEASDYAEEGDRVSDLLWLRVVVHFPALLYNLVAQAFERFLVEAAVVLREYVDWLINRQHGIPTVSYWSIAHPSGQPDFHASTGYRLRLPSLA